MRSETELRKRVQELVTAELDTRLRLTTQRLPHVCTHNHRHPLDVRKRVEDEANELYNRLERGPRLRVINTMGLCMLGAENIQDWPGNICEDPIDAQQCPWFTPRVSKDTVVQELSRQLQDMPWLQQNMPELAALMWVLETQSVQLPWWRRLWIRLMRKQPVEPQLVLKA